MLLRAVNIDRRTKMSRNLIAHVGTLLLRLEPVLVAMAAAVEERKTLLHDLVVEPELFVSVARPTV
jgi:hypothetical protein